jgi:hypothetical protein
VRQAVVPFCQYLLQLSSFCLIYQGTDMLLCYWAELCPCVWLQSCCPAFAAATLHNVSSICRQVLSQSARTSSYCLCITIMPLAGTASGWQ